VQLKNGTVYDLLASYSYDAQHLPLTVTNGAGQTTTNTCDPPGTHRLSDDDIEGRDH
jgi:hypothetical protein